MIQNIKKNICVCIYVKKKKNNNNKKTNKLPVAVTLLKKNTG